MNKQDRAELQAHFRKLPARMQLGNVKVGDYLELLDALDEAEQAYHAVLEMYEGRVESLKKQTSEAEQRIEQLQRDLVRHEKAECG